jgi:3-phosphoshikimate 1-carboxyvinyltransferase
MAAMMLPVGNAAHVRVSGELRVLGDKSISHRALLLGALARGRSIIHGVLKSGDTESTARVLRALGADVSVLAPTAIIEGRGLRGLTRATAVLDCGNSGTTARLLLGILAAQPFAATLVGDASLSRRPMRRVAEPLQAMGARIEALESHDGLPLTISGGDLRSIEWITPVASAQIKSAILLAGLCGAVPVTVEEPQRSRDHTERMLASLGVEIHSQTGAGDANRVSLVPAEGLPAFELTVPGDPSSAAYFAALAALAGAGEIALRGIALNPTRVGFIEVLRRMGADIVVDGGEALGEPVGDVRVRAGRPLLSTTIDANEVPSLIDEIPLLACVAVCATGEMIIRGAAELRVKESDRIAAIVSNLRALGITAEELPDGMRIIGAPGTRLRGSVRAFQDHRIAMAFATLGAATGAELEIDDPSCVAISYPDFWRDLARLTGA